MAVRETDALEINIFIGSIIVLIFSFFIYAGFNERIVLREDSFSYIFHNKEKGFNFKDILGIEFVVGKSYRARYFNVNLKNSESVPLTFIVIPRGPHQIVEWVEKRPHLGIDITKKL